MPMHKARSALSITSAFVVALRNVNNPQGGRAPILHRTGQNIVEARMPQSWLRSMTFIERVRGRPVSKPSPLGSNVRPIARLKNSRVHSAAPTVGEL